MSKNLVEILAKNIIIRRKNIGLSQKELAAKLDITHDAMSRLERAKMAPKFSRLQDIAEALHCSASSLLEIQNINATQRAKILTELLEVLTDEQQEAVMSVMYTTVKAMTGEE